jgi:hypothetical protein
MAKIKGVDMGYNRDTRELARRMYVKDGQSINTIGQALKISTSTLRLWATQGEWDYHRKSEEQHLNDLGEEAYAFAAFLLQEMKRKKSDKQELDKSEVNLFGILTGKIKEIVELDTMRKKMAKSQENSQDLPEEVRALPEVKKALAVIAEALDRAGKK